MLPPQVDGDKVSVLLAVPDGEYGGHTNDNVCALDVLDQSVADA